MNWNRLQSSSSTSTSTLLPPPQTRARHPAEFQADALRVQATRHAASNWNDNTTNGNEPQQQKQKQAAKQQQQAEQAVRAATTATATQQSSALPLLAQPKQRVKYFLQTPLHKHTYIRHTPRETEKKERAKNPKKKQTTRATDKIAKLSKQCRHHRRRWMNA